MAITFVGATSGTGAGTGVSLPGSYADGDIVIAFSYNRSSTAVPGAPTGGTYTFVLNNTSGFTNRAVLYYRVISGDTTFPGFASNSTHYALAIYRGQNKGDPIGASSSTTNNTATISYADFAEEYTDGTSWIIACGAHRNDATGSIVIDGDWNDRTFYLHQTTPNFGKIGIGDKSDITSWSGDTVATGGLANGHSSITFELKAEKTLSAASGSFTLTGTDATLTYDSGGYTITADAGSFTLTGTDANLEFGRLLGADAGSFTLTGTDASLEFGAKLAADAASFTLTGADAGLRATRLLTADATSYTLTGTAAGLATARLLTADAASYTLTGTDAGLRSTRLLTADSASYTLTGTDAALVYSQPGSYTLVADFASFVLTGTDAGLIYPRTFPADPATFTLTGTDANLEFGRLLTADGATFTLTGTDANLEFGRVLTADSVAYTLTGTDADFLAPKKIIAIPATFTLSGSDAALIWSGDTGRVRDGDGAGGERGRRRRRTGYRVHKWQIEDTPLEEAAEEIVAEVAGVPAEKAVEFIEANADILTLLGVPTAPMIDRLEAASTVALPRVADVEMARIRAIIEDYLDEEETIAMLLAS